MKKKLKVMRTGAGSPPSCGVINALLAEGCDVVTADADPMSFGLYRYPPGEVIPLAANPDFIPAVMKICRKHKINVIIPTVDEELPVFAAATDDFRKKGINVVVSELKTIETFTSKMNAFRAFRECGVRNPKTSLNPDEIKGSILTKPNKGRGGAGVANFRNAPEAKTKKGYIFQEKITGTEYTTDALCDFDGRLLCGAVRERLQTESGIAIKSRIVGGLIAKEIWADVEKIAGVFKFKGPFNVQCIRTASGENKFFDLNPRYAGTVALSIAAGVPMVRNLVRLLCGETVEPTGLVTKELFMFRYWSETYVEKGRRKWKIKSMTNQQ